MKKSLVFLAVLWLCHAYSVPMFATTKFDTRPSSNYQQDRPTFKKCQNQSFFKQVWQTVFPKRQLRQKPSNKARMNFGGGALIAVSLAAIAILISNFWALAIIALAASLVLGIIGLFRDERKTLAVIALSLTLVLPIVVIILINIYCCGP